MGTWKIVKYICCKWQPLIKPGRWDYCMKKLQWWFWFEKLSFLLSIMAIKFSTCYISSTVMAFAKCWSDLVDKNRITVKYFHQILKWKIIREMGSSLTFWITECTIKDIVTSLLSPLAVASLLAVLLATHANTRGIKPTDTEFYICLYFMTSVLFT